MAPVILVYEIEVKTADKEKASTVHNGWLIIKGKKGETKMKMKNSARDKILRRYTDLMTHGKSHQLQHNVCKDEDNTDLKDILLIPGTNSFVFSEVTPTPSATAVRTWARYRR